MRPGPAGGEPVADKPAEAEYGEHDDNDVHLVRVFLHHRPVLAQPQAAVEEEAVPQGGAGEREEHERHQRHPPHARRDGDEVADHRDETGDEHRVQPLAALEVALGQLQVVAVEQQVAAHLEHQRLAAVVAHPVREQRAEERAGTGGEHGQPQVPLAVGDEEADKGHDRLARHRRDHALQGHEDKGAEIGGGLQDLDGDAADEFGDHGRFTGGKSRRGQ